MKPAALVFDLGGVLIDIDFGRAFAAWSAAAGVPAADIAARFSADDAYRAHECGELDDRGYFAHLRHVLGVKLGDEAFRTGWNAIIGEPMPGIEALVRQLVERVPVYVFSNTNRAHVAYFTPRLAGLLALFRGVFTSCDFGCRKPEPEAFARLATEIGTPPGRLAFFDDVEANVAGARRAGLQAFHVTSSAEMRAISEHLLGERTAR